MDRRRGLRVRGARGRGVCRRRDLARLSAGDCAFERASVARGVFGGSPRRLVAAASLLLIPARAGILSVDTGRRPIPLHLQIRYSALWPLYPLRDAGISPGTAF